MMAGNGPPPKPSDRRARRNADPVSLRVYQGEKVSQPELPDAVDWPEITQRWWRTWGDEPMSADFRQTDWDFLADTALLHRAVWAEGELRLLPELRLRVGKLGATSEDRARLRITYAAADDAEEKPARRQSSRDRYRGLKASDGLAGA